MEKQVNQRIMTVLRHNNSSILAFSKEIGMPQQTVNRQIKGESQITISLINSLLGNYPDISAEWLLRGKGDMIIGTLSDINNIISNSSAVIKEVIEDNTLTHEDMAKTLNMSSTFDLDAIISGKRNMRVNEINAVKEKYPQYSLAWLMGTNTRKYDNTNDNIIYMNNESNNGAKTASELLMENAILKTRIEEKNEQIKMLRELIKK